jgi:uncharacterized circularly permuted ATP-grasp superfamily protein/uncharacterized alpha-E superfamily protein
MPTEYATTPADWLDAYMPAAGRHDELKNAFGEINPPWRKLVEALKTLSTAELAQRAEQVRSLIYENGITYNVYDEQGNHARPWGMDLLPMMLEQAEWEKIEGALSQRARLFNLILRDFYGPQTLIEKRVVPPGLVLGNPAFLRSCHGLAPPDGMFIPIYGADLGRAPSGQWWVLSERVDAPSGFGYALENRALTTRVFSDWLRDNRVVRLASFAQTLRESLARLAARRGDSPRMVLLTPGPANETYFEHSYLARNLGFSLVEGGDLVVRAQRVYLKTLTGLRQVDLILRRVDSSFCDPLELRNDSLLGVPGLLQAGRAGNVTMANAPGAGVLESPGLSPFLPALCRHLLGEELKMPSVATWWCGQPRELAYVEEHLDSLILQPAFAHSPRELVVGPRLSAGEREEWIRRLRHQPEAWCAREWVALATTPVFENNRFVPHIFQMRTLLVAAEGGDYRAMPGGLTRIPAGDDDLMISMQQGGRSKDTWVLLPPELPPPAEISPSTAGPIKLRRAGADLPSRVADNLYWLGRYLERTEGQTQILRLLVGAFAEEGGAADPALWRPFFATLRIHDAGQIFTTGEQPTLNLAAAEEALRRLVWDVEQPNSLAANLARFERTAYRVKERLPGDLWSLLGRLQRPARAPAGSATFLRDAFNELENAVTLLTAINGFMAESMIHGHGWRFLDLGRRIERGINIAELLRQTVGRPGVISPAMLHNLLVVCESLLIYRRRYLTNLQIVPVLDLLVCDEANPRGLAFQFRSIQQHVMDLPREPGTAPANRPVEQMVLELANRAVLADAHQLAQADWEEARPELMNFTAKVAHDLAALSDALGLAYFAHSGAEVEN